ncbi:uncharacterized protein LOC121405951 [Lytechinus variegatus]|uniref:uncharacterized protein LOC121405951 n=1 Tax=Lytechinus variegatus TaxID=7654 RepID=UPI001BB13D5A|nr:uncharacterized protein LOC121405951 [Lytechinus variegatus]
MRALFILMSTALAVSMVASQPPSYTPWPVMPPGDPLEPFQNPGEIVPNTGLTIPYLINAAGGIWQQGRAIDSAAYFCSDVLPFIASVVPEVDDSSLIWGPLCDDVREASSDLDNFDATGWCNGIIDMFFDPTNLVYGGRVRRQSSSMGYPESMELPFNIVEILVNITRDLYGIDINVIIEDVSMIRTICTANIKDHFLRPSLEDVITTFGSELMAVLLPHARPICEDFDGFLQSLMVNSSSEKTIAQDIRDLAAQAVGFSNGDALCENILSTLEDGSIQARRSFSEARFSSVFRIPESAGRCSVLLNGLIDDVIEPIVQLGYPSGMMFSITDEMIYMYTGFPGPDPVDRMCRVVEIAFTTLVDLPDSVPIQLIPETNLSVEFFINAAGGLWLRERTIDSFDFGCREILPDLLRLAPLLTNYSAYYEPICSEIREAANDLDAFDAEGSCNDLKATFMNLINQDAGRRRRRQAEDPTAPSFDIIEILEDILRDVYNIDISDESTICPNIGQFLGPALPDLVTRFVGELTNPLLPASNYYVCSDWTEYLPSVGIYTNSSYYPIILAAADIGSRMLGYENRNDICTAIQEGLTNGDEAGKRFGRNAFESAIDIFTDVDRCIRIGTDAVDDVVEPVVRVLLDHDEFEVTRYMMARYTGYSTVQEICIALETAFTELFNSTLTVTITVETLNGEELQFTDDLNNRNSAAFKRLETAFCGGVVNLIENESGARRVECTVTSFSPGSVVAELDVMVYATTQTDADGIAESVSELSADVLSFDGDSLGVSEITSMVTGGAGKIRSPSIGAIVFFALGVVTAGL